MLKRYARNGWAVVPVAAGAKAPTLKGWQALQPAGVKETLARVGDAKCVGIVTGASSGLVVLDLDAKHGLEAILDGLKESHGAAWLDTYTVQTAGGGVHLYYQHPGGIVRNATRLGGRDGVDVRGDGGQVVAPPSLGANGRPYKIVVDRDPAPCPAWLLEELRERDAVETAPKAGRNDRGGAVVTVGGRDAYLTSVAGAMRRVGASEVAMQAALEAENEERCEPPLEARDLHRIARSVGRYGPEDVRGGYVPARAVRGDKLYPKMLAFLRDDERRVGLPTGNDFVDGALGGGRRPGEITGWHAVAKAGKSSWVHMLMWQLTKGLGRKVGYASREMDPAEEVLTNLLTLDSGRSAWRNPEKVQADPPDWLRRVYFADGYGYIPEGELLGWSLELQRKRGVQHFVLDHLLYALEDPEDFKAASKLCRALKAHAREHGQHWDVIIQPYKIPDGQSVSMNSVRGGAAIVQAFDNLFCMERVKGHANVTRVWLETARSKLATMGKEGFFEYDRESTRFTEVEPVFDAPGGHDDE